MSGGARRRSVAAVALAAALGLALGPTPEALEVAVVDLSDHPTVRVVFAAPESMRDEEIGPESVTLHESGEEQQIRLLPLGAEPLAAVLAIDVSGSMAGEPLAAAKDAAIAFLTRMPEGSEFALIAFGSQVEVVADFGTPRDEVEAAIRGLALAGNTALYDAIIESVELVNAQQEARRFVLILSDGADTVSTASRSDVVELVAGTDGIDFVAVELQGIGVDSEALAEIAEAAGGRVIEADDPAELLAIYDALATEVISQYSVEYETTRSGATVVDLEVADDQGTVYARSFTISLPAAPPPTTTTTTEPAAPPTIPVAIDPPPTAFAPAPGPFSDAWTLVAGAGALFVTLLIVSSYLLRPADGAVRRVSVLDDVHGSRQGLFSRISAGLTGGADRLFSRSERAGGLARSLEAAGVALRPGEFAVIVAVGVLGSLLLGMALGQPLTGFALAATAAVAPRLLLGRLTSKRRDAFADQLDGALQLIAGSLRAGYGLTQALDAVASEAPKPISDEFHRVIVEVRLGRDMLSSMLALSRRMNSTDMLWVAEAIGIQREVGGDLSEVLDTVSTTIRERSQLRRQVHALSAEGRLSAVVLVALPIVLAAFIAVVNPGYFEELLAPGIGRVLMAVSVGLMAVGIVWVSRIVKIEF